MLGATPTIGAVTSAKRNDSWLVSGDAASRPVQNVQAAAMAGARPPSVPATTTSKALKLPVGKVKAGELVNFVAQQVGGKGGGKADMAMAGGTEPGKLAGALASVQGWVAGKL